MAEYLLRNLAGDRFETFSAGIKPAPQIHPLTLHIADLYAR
jgi:arsenate reductase